MSFFRVHQISCNFESTFCDDYTICWQKSKHFPLGPLDERVCFDKQFSMLQLEVERQTIGWTLKGRDPLVKLVEFVYTFLPTGPWQAKYVCTSLTSLQVDQQFLYQKFCVWLTLSQDGNFVGSLLGYSLCLFLALQEFFYFRSVFKIV